MGTDANIGIEILDQSAGQLVPETANLDSDRILIRAYGKKLHPETISAALAPFPTSAIVEQTVIDEEWREKWKSFFRRTRVGTKIVVRPPWEPRSEKPSDIDVIIEPGMAFGTGLHETTRLCIRAIEECVAEGDSVLDVGCGSGILSIIAAKLGASTIHAIDVDADAVRTTRENADKNAVSATISATNIPLADITQSYELVIANILSHILISLSTDLARVVRPGGTLLLSGILDEQVDRVRTTFTRCSLVLEEQRQDGEWVSMQWSRSA
jgi:ribosomal protein L11 methyltransferase